MKLIFSDQPLPTEVTKSMFLAGPSPRPGDEMFHWRHHALSFLESEGYDGTVFIPIPKSLFDGDVEPDDWTYMDQIGWECDARAMADLIVFWVDRNIEKGVLGLTTNVEFGEDLNTGKVLLGHPQTADKVKYMDARMGMPPISEPTFTDLGEILMAAMDMLGEGAERRGGEVKVPLMIWETPQFQLWYKQLLENGNKLTDAKVLSSNRLLNGFVFSFTLWVNVYITTEKRNKSNEFIFSRTDISTILPFYRGEDGTKVVLIKEFRSPVRNADGIVWELPGGSSVKPGVDPQANAQHELQEETGITIEDLSRFELVGDYQLAATLCTHKAHLYRVELTQDEYEQVLDEIANGATFGVQEDTEITYLEVIDVDDILQYPLDFSMMGMILSGLPK